MDGREDRAGFHKKQKQKPISKKTSKPTLFDEIKEDENPVATPRKLDQAPQEPVDPSELIEAYREHVERANQEEVSDRLFYLGNRDNPRFNEFCTALEKQFYMCEDSKKYDPLDLYAYRTPIALGAVSLDFIVVPERGHFQHAAITRAHFRSSLIHLPSMFPHDSEMFVEVPQGRFERSYFFYTSKAERERELENIFHPKNEEPSAFKRKDKGKKSTKITTETPSELDESDKFDHMIHQMQSLSVQARTKRMNAYKTGTQGWIEGLDHSWCKDGTKQFVMKRDQKPETYDPALLAAVQESFKS